MPGNVDWRIVVVKGDNDDAHYTPTRYGNRAYYLSVLINMLTQVPHQYPSTCPLVLYAKFYTNIFP
jgi:hypothetical protein